MATRKSSGHRASRWALLHFALLGLLLFVGSRWLGLGPDEAALRDARIVISRAQLEAWERRYEETSGKPVDDAVRQALIRQYADDEMLYREARVWGLAEGNQAIDLRLRQKMAFVADADMADGDLLAEAVALGLDGDDAVIRNMLTHNMRLLLARSGEQPPTEAEIEALYAAEPQAFAGALRFTGWQIFFAREGDSAAMPERAQSVRRRILAEQLEPASAVRLGDTGPLPAQFRGQQVHQLVSRFGEDFARVVQNLNPGTWSEPVTTPFGVHLIQLERRHEPVTPPLSQIRERVAAVLQARAREQRLTQAMHELRRLYEVVVEAPRQPGERKAADTREGANG